MTAHPDDQTPRQWDALGGRALTHILKLINPQTQQGLQESGLIAVSSHWFYLIPFTLTAPDDLSQQYLLDAYPYTAPRRIKESLQILAAQGFLKPVGGLKHVATDKGKAAIETVARAQRKGFQQLSFLPDAQGERLMVLLTTLVDAVRQLETPEKRTFDVTARRPITAEMPVLEVITRMLALLSRYRDDMHQVSWRSADKVKAVDGIQWDTLTHIWRGDARSAGAIAAALPFRGYSKSDYTAAIKKLVKRGWLSEAGTDASDDGTDDGTADASTDTAITAAIDGPEYQTTSSANDVRIQSEQRTDEMFYRAWDALTPSESAELDNLLHMVLAATSSLLGSG